MRTRSCSTGQLVEQGRCHGRLKIDDLEGGVWRPVWTDTVCELLLVNRSMWCVVFGTW